MNSIPGIFAHGRYCVGYGRFSLFCGNVRPFHRHLDFSAKRESWHDIHTGGKFKLIDDHQILRLRHGHDKFRPLAVNRQDAATFGNGVGKKLQNFGLDFDVFAINVGKVGNFSKCGSEVLFGDQPALQHKLAKVDELSVLFLNRFGEIGRGYVTPFPQDLAEPFSLHRLATQS